MKLLVKLFALCLLLFSSLMLYERYEFSTREKISALQRIDPIPQTLKLIDQNKYAQASKYLGFFMQYDYVKYNPKAKELYEALEFKRNSMGYQSKKALEGVIYGKSDEIIGKVSAGISDFFVFGDLRDLAIEGYHHISGDKVDKVLVGLSTIGVIATGATLMSAGSATPLKGGISAMKMIRKSGKMPLWLEKFIIRSSKEIKNTKDIKPVESFFKDIYTVSKTSGLDTTVKLLEKSPNMKVFHNSLGFAKMFGKDSNVLFKILGDDAPIYYRLLKDKSSKKTFLKAATYGEPGIKRLAKMGEKGFLKSIKPAVLTSRLAKIFNKHIIHILKLIPSAVYILFAVIAIAILI